MLQTIKPQFVFFDLDHTLWDMDKNASNTLLELYDLYAFGQLTEKSPEVFIATYFKYNQALWKSYEAHQIDKFTLRTQRFVLAMDEMGIPKAQQPKDIWQQFLLRCPYQTQLMPGARELLEFLAPQFPLGIITNGFSETQRLKLKNAGLLPYFSHILISEEVGSKKPEPAIFEKAGALAKVKHDAIVMIGDNPETDIAGAKQAGWFAICYNPEQQLLSHDANIEIAHLSELQLLW